MTKGGLFAARCNRPVCSLIALGIERVGFVQRDDFRFVGEPVAVGGELLAHRVVGLAGV